MATCMATCSNFSYMFLNLVGEIGEFASKVAKHIRKQDCTIGDLYENQLDWYEREMRVRPCLWRNGKRNSARRQVTSCGNYPACVRRWGGVLRM